MKGEPKWETKQIMQLNWVFDEYFVTPEAYHKVFEPLGVHCKEVQNNSGKPLKTVVQLISTEQIAIDTSNQKQFTCTTCGTVKFARITRGYSPSVVTQPKVNYAKTDLSFGDGASSNRLVYVSSNLYRSILNAGLKGVSFRAVK